MPKILLIPFGKIDKEILEDIQANISETFRSEARILSETKKIPECEERGNQLNAGDFIPIIQSIVKKKNVDFGLGIVDQDLYSGNLNFVFGIAYLNSSVISLTRLKSENKELFFKRAVKEAVHELGHLFGMDHCENPNCVMHFSNCLEDTDIKSEKFCEICERELNV